MTPSIYIVDDDRDVRMSLHALLSTFSGRVIRGFDNGDHFLQSLDELGPGVVLLDFHMAGTDGLGVMEAIKGEPKFATVMITGRGNIDLAVRAMKAGAFDFLEKPYAPEEILGAVDNAIARVEHAEANASRVGAAKLKMSSLTPREMDALKGLIAGRSNKIIAFELGLSQRTVEVYRATMMDRLGVQSLPEALRIAFAAGIVDHIRINRG